MGKKELLTDDQRENILELNQLSEFEFASYYSLSDDDIDIINHHRRDSNRLGFAIQLCLVRYPGCTLSNIKKVPQDLIQYVASQINVDSDVFSSYATRNTTKREHLEGIRQTYGYKNFDNYDSERIFKLLIQNAQENNNALFLIQIAINLLRDDKIILPTILTIEKLVSSARKQAETVIFSILTDGLSKEQKDKLEKIIDSNLDNKKTPLAWLRELPGHSSPDSFIKVIQRLKYIKAIGLKVNLSCIHQNRFLQLARLGSRYEPHSFRRFKENKKLALLVSHLIFLSQELTDHAIEIHDRQMLILQAKGRKIKKKFKNKMENLLMKKSFITQILVWH